MNNQVTQKALHQPNDHPQADFGQKPLQNYKSIARLKHIFLLNMIK